MLSNRARPMFRWGLKTKIFMLTLLPSLVIALLTGSLLLQSRFAALDDAFIANSEMIIQKFIPELRQSLSINTSNSLHNSFQIIANRFLEESDVRAVNLYNAQKILLAHAGPSMKPKHHTQWAFLPLLPSIHPDDHTLRLMAPIFSGSAATINIDSTLKPLGWIELELTRTNIELKKYQLLLTASFIILVSLLIQVLLTLKLSQNISQYFNKITAVIQQVKKGQLETPLKINSQGEMRQLETAINEMIESIKVAQIELKQSVEQATEDLRETLETIEIQNIELDLARKEALEASRIKSEFLANMSHEIRTPLNGIIGFTKLLLKGTLTERQRDYLNTIQKSSDGLLAIINDILDFSKIEAGKLVLDNMTLNIRQVVEEVLTLIAPLAHEKQLELIALIYSDVPIYLRGDALRLKQVITNLVNNAIKFTEKGNIILSVTFESLNPYQAMIKIAVTDTGIGLSIEDQKIIFSAFNQADTSAARRFGGTGLGLVISKHLVEQMGGNIGLESELNKGATFWFTVRMDIDSKNQNIPLPKALQHKRIMIFDANPVVRLSLRHLLDSWKMHIAEAVTFTDLQTQLIQANENDHAFDACILGLAPDEILSKSLLSRLQYFENDLNCRCIILTHTQAPLTEQNLLDQTISGYAAKPICHDKLYDLLTTAINHPLTTTPLHTIDPSEKKLSMIPTEIQQPHALVVDDNSANLKLLCALLADFNVRTTACKSGAQAVEQAKSQIFSIIFMDIQMPKMDGIEATRLIRALEKSPQRTPIIAVTAHALANEKQALLKAGMDDYITKPIHEMQLKQLIETWTTHRISQSAQTPLPSTEPLPVDLSEGLQLANQKSDLANDLLVMLLNHFPQDKMELKTAWEEEDYALLLERVHKLHGATRYCGVPLLRQCAHLTETLIKEKKYTQLPNALRALLDAMQQIETWVEQHYPSRSFYPRYPVE